MGCKDCHLPIKPENRSIDVRLFGQYARIADAISRGEVIRAIDDYIIILDQVHHIFRVHQNLMRDDVAIRMRVEQRPCGGGPLQYRPLKNGRAYQLYSIGTDLKDDGGTPARYVGLGPGDIVAGKMWRKRTFTKK